MQTSGLVDSHGRSNPEISETMPWLSILLKMMHPLLSVGPGIPSLGVVSRLSRLNCKKNSVEQEVLALVAALRDYAQKVGQRKCRYIRLYRRNSQLFHETILVSRKYPLPFHKILCVNPIEYWFFIQTLFNGRRQLRAFLFLHFHIVVSCPTPSGRN